MICPQAADAHADVTVYRPKSGLVVALRAERLSASRTRVNAGAMMLNLRCDHLFLQASQNCLALAYRQSQGGRRELLYTLNRGNFVLGGLARNHLRNQLQCPFYPNSLRHPTTLHALYRRRGQNLDEAVEPMLRREPVMARRKGRLSGSPHEKNSTAGPSDSRKMKL